MANFFSDFRFLLFIAACIFIYIQMRLFATQSQYADRLAAAIEAESHCTSQTRLLIQQISSQEGRIVDLEEERRLLVQENQQLKTLVHDLRSKSLLRLVDKVQVPVAAVVIMACNRADYLGRTINSVLKYQRPIALRFPLFVSQDGSDLGVKLKALSYDQLTYMQHLDLTPVETERPGELIVYYKIARHYKWALDQLFYKHKFGRVIILEDDMEIAPDFFDYFDYFEAAGALLDQDKSIMAVSSWNDNGQKQYVHDPYELYRSDFFPGLGWMLDRSTWDELSPKWPKAYWDDWLRLKENRKGRQFIRPEVCRTYNFGEHAHGHFVFANERRFISFFIPFKQYLEPIKLNDFHVNWKSMDLSYLTKYNYALRVADMLKKAKPIIGVAAILKAANIEGDVCIKYKDQSDFEYIARQFGIFEEWKDGVPRTAYNGLVVFRHQNTRHIFLVGPDSDTQLGIEVT